MSLQVPPLLMVEAVWPMLPVELRTVLDAAKAQAVSVGLHERAALPTFNEGVWELYDQQERFSRVVLRLVNRRWYRSNTLLEDRSKAKWVDLAGAVEVAKQIFGG